MFSPYRYVIRNNNKTCCYPRIRYESFQPVLHDWCNKWGGNFDLKCISTTPIGAPIYIWPRAAIAPAPPLRVVRFSKLLIPKFKVWLECMQMV